MREIVVDQHRSKHKLNNDTQRRLGRALGQIPDGARVTLEGPPIYLNRAWGDDHEFGFNCLLPEIQRRLQDRAGSIEHVVLLDDYTCSSSIDKRHFLERMKLKADKVVHESSLAEEGSRELQDMIRENRAAITSRGVVLSLDQDRKPLVQTRSERIGCCLLDAVFQRDKGNGHHVIVHPRSFRRQQQEMRAVLRQIGNTPQEFGLLNIFTKGRNISQVFQTNSRGITKVVKV